MRTIGSRIRGFREEREVDLQTLSQNTGLTEDYLEKLESDAIYPVSAPCKRWPALLACALALFWTTSFRATRW